MPKSTTYAHIKAVADYIADSSDLISTIDLLLHYSAIGGILPETLHMDGITQH